MGLNLNLEAKLNKRHSYRNPTINSEYKGFYCSILKKVCQCLLKDSLTYLDHINGKWHQRALGLTMRVEKSGVEKVRERIKLHYEKMEDSRESKASDSLLLLKKSIKCN